MQAAGRGATVATFIADLSSQDVFVIALEADQFQVGRSPVHQPLDHLATLRRRAHFETSTRACAHARHGVLVDGQQMTVDGSRVSRSADWYKLNSHSCFSR